MGLTPLWRKDLFDLTVQSIGYALEEDLARCQRVKTQARIIDPSFHVLTRRTAKFHGIDRSRFWM